MAIIELSGVVGGIGTPNATLSTKFALAGTAAGIGTLGYGPQAPRVFMDVDGLLGEIPFADPDGVWFPIESGSIQDGDVPTWDEANNKFVYQAASGGGSVSNDVKDVWTLLPIGDATTVIPTGLWPAAAYLPPGAIQEVSVFGKEASGSIVLDIWADTPGNWPPTIADSIVASAKPTISAAQKAVNVARTGWTDNTGVGKMFYVNVDSVSSFTLVTLWVRTRRA